MESWRSLPRNDVSHSNQHDKTHSSRRNEKLTNKIQEQVVGFDQEDPLRTWFTVELDAIGVREDTDELSLDEPNARMPALNQLHYLVFQHNVQLKNPDISEELTQASMAVLIQSRYHAINALIAGCHTSQIV